MNRFKLYLKLGLYIILILIFALCLIVFSEDFLYQNKFNKDTILATILFFIFLSLSIWGFIKNFKLLRNYTKDKIEYFDQDFCFSISNKIEYKDYRNLNIELIFKKPWIIAIGIILLLNIAGFIINYKQYEFNLTYLIPFIIFILTPFFIFLQIKSAYKNQKALHEEILYSLDNLGVKIQGQSFVSEIKWEYYLKIIETKKFFLLYQNKTTANILSKSKMNENNILILRSFGKYINSRS